MYDGDWKALIDEYFQAVGKDSGTLGNVYAITSQYTDSGGGRAAYSSTFRGYTTDTNPYPASGCADPAPEPERFACLTDAQIRAELSSFVPAHQLRTGLGTIFFVFTPPGVTVCTDAGGALAGHCSDSSKKNPWAKEAPSPSSEEIAERGSYERSFCSYHAYIGPQSNPIVYAVQPWTAGNAGMFLPVAEEVGTVLGSDCENGTESQQEPNRVPSPGVDSDGDLDKGLADVILNETSVEQIAAETDPLLNGWYAPVGQANAGNEVTDQCRNWFAPALGGNPAAPGTLYNQLIAGHNYYLNTEYNQAALTRDYPGVACIPGVSLVPQFTSPNAVNVGDVVGFDATESKVSLGVAEYEWNFGDGSAPLSGESDASVFHSYTYGGTYYVTLKITDTGGDSASATNPVIVVGPPRPSSIAPAGSSPSAGSFAATSPSGQSGTPASTPAPVVGGFVVSKSLKKALSGGLAVRYTVNEQVAGSIQVLLDGATAKRLGIRGATATGLPKGSPSAIVVGTAVLVTTKAGQGTIRVKFSSRTASHLALIHRLKLTLRLFARNASRQSPQTTTVLSAVVLNR
ncbi:MAG TPA: PKD domain-containing protein [Solirubrobacteraceae bacterium]|nr:PKD domain-containing protein [Solirubrobacteraceae bacterium]